MRLPATATPAAKQPNLYCEVTEGMHAYGVSSHRHMPEIEQGLSEVVGQPVLVSFTPHLIPMSRGMLCTTIVEMADGVTRECAGPGVFCMHSAPAPEHRFSRRPVPRSWGPEEGPLVRLRGGAVRAGAGRGPGAAHPSRARVQHVPHLGVPGPHPWPGHHPFR